MGEFRNLIELSDFSFQKYFYRNYEDSNLAYLLFLFRFSQSKFFFSLCHSECNTDIVLHESLALVKRNFVNQRIKKLRREENGHYSLKYNDLKFYLIENIDAHILVTNQLICNAEVDLNHIADMLSKTLGNDIRLFMLSPSTINVISMKKVQMELKCYKKDFFGRVRYVK